MNRPVIAVVTGFTRNDLLCQRAFAPLRALKRRGIIQRILYVCWDTPELDAFVAPAAAMTEVELVRVPQPDITGAPYQKGVIYQIRNLEAALALVPEKDALIVKLRPDFIFDPKFLEEKITNFDTLCARSTLNAGAPMPASPFKAKIWLPWADANQPFFYEDAAFIGLKQDVAKLASREAEKHLDVLADKACGWFAHVVRFATIFAPSYPIFQRYIRDFRYFPNDLYYRMALLPALTDDGFFWHLVITHAWIMANNFHVDCGQPGQLSLCTNISNPDKDWSRYSELKFNSPYDDIATWRQGQVPGGILPGAGRAYGRLMDDDWQQALFTRDVLKDVTPENLRGVLRNATLYRQGVLADAEEAFYRRLASFHQRHWRKAA